LRFGNLADRLVLVTGTGVIDVNEGSGGEFPADPQAAFQEWNGVLAWAKEPGGCAVPFVETDLGPPSPRPRQVFGIGLNYASHAAETGTELPTFPTTFTKFASCISSPHSVVTLPSATVDWEVELVVVIGHRAFGVSEASAMSHVAGLTVGQDLSDRAVQLRPPVPQFSLGKSFPGFGPIGPYLVTPDEFDNPNDLAISCTLNGEVVQQSRTNDLVLSVAALVSALSSIVVLLPGDLIFTGTPGGVGFARTPPRYLRPGDELASSIEGVGTVITHFEAERPE
jgi:2,4-didehydro-3-deoxy-L-rhamnonate hydrolase